MRLLIPTTVRSKKESRGWKRKLFKNAIPLRWVQKTGSVLENSITIKGFINSATIKKKKPETEIKVCQLPLINLKQKVLRKQSLIPRKETYLPDINVK